MVTWRGICLIFLCVACFTSLSRGASAADKKYTVTAQAISLAPNAGGQDAYALRLGTNDWEAGIFSNQYITAGGRPLSGGSYDFRFPICDDSCWWQLFAQMGGGFSNGGPFAELTWGSILPLLPIWLPTGTPRYWPALRLDITTQMIFIRSPQIRGVTWSYPLWAGVSVAF